MSINELFTNENRETSASARQLSGTAELTHIANNTAVRIINSMGADIESYRPRIAESALDSKKMDALLDEFKPWADIEEDSQLRHLDEKTVDGMLKSQQSKRSRLKGKTMTLDNYTHLMSAAIAENLIRELYNMPKNASHYGRRATALNYTPAELEAFAADQEALRREIRNIQSKKSIMKSKADFDEASEPWLALLKAEQMLKDLRVGGRSVDHTKNALTEMLDGVDLEHLKAADAKELLAAIKSMAAE